MKFYYHKADNGNVGDDLNLWLWDKLLPGLFSGPYYHTPTQRSGRCEESLFIGIGTLLDHLAPEDIPKAIFSTGMGYGCHPKIDKTWKFYCVRGPLTAKKLNLPTNLVITDGAALCSKHVIREKNHNNQISFIPHISTHCQQNWKNLCEEMDIRYLPPTTESNTFLSELTKSKFVICEAMHGAILADSLRVPWIPVSTHNGILEFKWLDWCRSMNIEYNPISLPSLWDYEPNPNLKTRYIFNAKYISAKYMLTKIIRKSTPILSKEKILNEKIILLEEQLECFKNDLAVGVFG